MTSVGHFHYSFFEPSETFIYYQLRNLIHFRPVAISLLTCDLDEKRLPNGVLYDVGVQLPRPGLQFIYPFRYSALKLSAELFKREGISLLHCHFGTWGAYALPLKKSLKLPLVVTFYGQDVSALPRRIVWRNRFQQLWKKADLILAEGPHMMAELARLGAPREKIRLQRIGIPVSKIDYRSPVIKKGKPVALWAGRMVGKKGLLDALEAIEILKSNGVNLELRIIGDGPERKKAEKFVDKKDLRRYVSFLGFLRYRSYLAEFKQADFLLAPSKTSSRGETEGGAPTTILEAQARGLPVVATRHADIPFVLPRDYPYLADEADPPDLARCIQMLLADRKKWPEIARKGRRQVARFNDLSVTIPTLEKYYTQLLGRED